MLEGPGVHCRPWESIAEVPHGESLMVGNDGWLGMRGSWRALVN